MKRARYPTLADIWKVLALNPTEDKQVEALAGLQPGKAVIFKAIDALEESGKDAKALERYASGLAWDLDRRAGSKPPKLNDKRIYQVQSTSTGSACFVRISTCTLGLQKGEFVDAFFEDGEIRLRVHKKRRSLTASA